MKGWSVGKLWAAVVASGLAAAYFAMWFIQTAWLGSFPGAHREYYGRWTLIQFLVSVTFFVAMLFAGFALFRRYKAENKQHGDARG